VSPFTTWLGKALDVYETSRWVFLLGDVNEAMIAMWRSGHLPSPRIINGILGVLLVGPAQPLRDEWLRLADMPISESLGYKDEIMTKLNPTLGHYVLSAQWDDLKRQVDQLPYEKAAGLLRSGFVKALVAKVAP
jgi:hypothetical protein